MICSFAYGSIVLSYRRCSSSCFSPILEVVYVYGVNFVKSLFKGQHKRLDDANPIRDLNGSRISWMVSFVSWLDNCKTYSNTNNTACLTNETYTALRHTVNTMVCMLYELLNSHTLDYVMLGKFQTDNLESRFGQYRQLSGCDDLVSVAEVMQSEKKLRIK